MIRWIVLLLLLPLPALAQDTTADEALAPGEYSRFKDVEYFCTDAEGNRRELGEVICITASCTTWMARCDLSLTNVMWRKMQDGCPGVSLIDRLDRLRPIAQARPARARI